jgi:glycosyltransferase involved in cell wall biosynthesis
MYRGCTVAVAVPAYNEAGYVGDVIDSVPPFVDRAYVVDDGSTDGTWAEITTHAERRNRDHEGVFDDLVVPVRHEENRGVGGAIKTAYRRAREEGMDVTAVLAGDGQMDAEVLPRFLDPIVEGDADYTKGNRFADPAGRSAIPRFRRAGNRLLSLLTKVASGYWGSLDSQNGYTAISRTALDRADFEGMYEYYGYCNDLLVRLNVADLRVADIPQSPEYVYEGDWQSHIEYPEYVPKVSLLLLRSFLWRLWRKYLRRGHPVALLYPAGALLTGRGVLETLGARAADRARAAERGRGVLAGLVVLGLAAVLDWLANRDLEAHVEPADTDESERLPASAAQKNGSEVTGGGQAGRPTGRETDAGFVSDDRPLPPE